MDLSFRLPDPAAPDSVEGAELPAADMALLVAMLADRQATSATAQVQAAIGAADDDHGASEPLAPADGSFNPAMAARITEWKQA